MLFFKKFFEVVEHMTLKKIDEAMKENRMLKALIDRLKEAIRDGFLKGCSHKTLDTHGIEYLFEAQIQFNNNKIIILKKKADELKQTKHELQKKVNANDVEIQKHECDRSRILTRNNRRQNKMFYKMPSKDQDSCCKLMDQYINISNTLTFLKNENRSLKEQLKKIELKIGTCTASLAHLTNNLPESNEPIPDIKFLSFSAEHKLGHKKKPQENTQTPLCNT